MKKQVMFALFGMLMKSITPKLIRDTAESFLDYVDAKVLGDKSEYNDKYILPVTHLIRELLKINEDSD